MNHRNVTIMQLARAYGLQAALEAVEDYVDADFDDPEVIMFTAIGLLQAVNDTKRLVYGLDSDMEPEELAAYDIDMGEVRLTLDAMDWRDMPPAFRRAGEVLDEIENTYSMYEEEVTSSVEYEDEGDEEPCDCALCHPKPATILPFRKG